MSDSFWTEMGKQLPSAAYERGREAERAAIVAWLRDDWSSSTAVVDASYEIESGEHLRATRTEPRDDELPPPSM